MLLDEITVRLATKEELLKAQEELDMYSVLTDKEIYIHEIIDNRLSMMNA